MPLFGNYEKAGSGISKERTQKKPFFRFWEILGRKFWKLMELNMILALSALPLVAALAAIFYLGQRYTAAALTIAGVMLVVFAAIFGPNLAAVTKILRFFTLEKPCFMMETYWRTFRSCFKQACPLGLIDLLVGASVASAVYVYPQVFEIVRQSGEGIAPIYYTLFVLTLSIAIAVLMMSFYGYLMIVSTDLSFKNVIKNSLALSFLALKQNLLTLFLSAAVMGFFGLLTLRFPMVMMIVWIFFPTAYVGFLIVFNCYPVIQKYVINPYYAQRGEVSPEMQFAENAGENLFEDRGGTEAPVEPAVEPKKKGKKGKIVS
ncbi:MAG: hypothetical protein IJ906_16885 [Oscillospiraceae bacterium]|nr:hypothetical protein [Oscillospiraceae bacterium]